MATKQQYLVRLGAKQLIAVSPSEFARLRGMKRLFEWHKNKPERLRLNAAYVGWIEGNEMRFQEKVTGKIARYVRSPEDSCARIERLCSAQDPRYIKDDRLRQREVERQYS